MLIPNRWCWPPIFWKIFKTSWKENIICIPLSIGVHFQGYIVNIDKHKIINIDSLRWNPPVNQNSQPTFECLFSKRKHFNANSYRVWLVAGMYSHLINLREISDRYNGFDITYNLLEWNYIIQNVESLFPEFSIEDQMEKIASAEFLICVLTNDLKSPSISGSLQEIRTNLFFITDIPKTSISNINANDNGAYLKSRNTNKFYYCDKDRTSVVREDISGKFYYNERLSRNS